MSRDSLSVTNWKTVPGREWYSLYKNTAFEEVSKAQDAVLSGNVLPFTITYYKKK